MVVPVEACLRAGSSSACRLYQLFHPPVIFLAVRRSTNALVGPTLGSLLATSRHGTSAFVCRERHDR